MARALSDTFSGIAPAGVPRLRRRTNRGDARGLGGARVAVATPRARLDIAHRANALRYQAIYREIKRYSEVPWAHKIRHSVCGFLH